MNSNNFDWIFYVNYYEDLTHIKNEEQARQHWLRYGKKEGRICNFNWLEYCKQIPELNDNVTKKIAFDHWLKNPNKTTINFSLNKNIRTNDTKINNIDNFDWEFYISYYPDLNKLNSYELAYRHWCRYGKKEGRICYNNMILPNNILQISDDFNYIDIIKNNKKFFVYYSKNSWSLLFQRPHQICRFFNKDYLKIFITIENINKFEEQYNLLILSYKNVNNIFNNIKNPIIYYTDSRLYEEINILCKKYNCRRLFDLIDAPINEFSVWLPYLESCVKSADWVVYSHPDLKKYLYNSDSFYISNACDYDHFNKAKERIGERPTEFPETNKINNKLILGYYGAFSEWLDFDLIKKYADDDKYHIIMIGGITTNKQYNIRFPHPNITWIDHKPYEELPYYLSWFDVCFLPFKDCELTKFVNPCKLWEYMASGKEIIKYNVNIECNEIVKYTDIVETLFNIINDNFDNFIDFKKNIIDNYKYIFITLPIIPWNTPLYQRPQHIAHNFAKNGFLSIYISISNEDKSDHMFKKLDNNLWITSNIKEILTIKNGYYSFYSTGYANNFIEYVDIINKNGGFIIYEYIDHIDEKISVSKENCDKLLLVKNFAFNNMVNLIVASADLLYNDVKNNSKTDLIMVKNGVSVNHYISKKDKPFTFPTKLINFKNKYKNICGYFGAIAPWLDYNIINNIIKLRKDIGFIFIGPDYLDNVKKLPNTENFYYITSIDYSILPYYAYLFDICFIPFEEGEIAKTTSPLKLYEYFALQKPVITSSFMLECINYKEVLHYKNITELNNKIDEAILLKNNIEYKNKLITHAYENDWNERVKIYAKKLKELEHSLLINNYLILISSTHNDFIIDNNNYTFIHKWGINTCSINFNKKTKIKKIIPNKYSNLSINCFSETPTTLNIKINNQLYKINITNHITNNIIHFNHIDEELNISIYTNNNTTIYISNCVVY